jgi:hypothetical protein
VAPAKSTDEAAERLGQAGFRTVARVTGTPPSVASFDSDFRRPPAFEIWGLR